MGVGLIHFLCGKSYLNDLSFMLSCMVSCYSRKAYICQGGGASFSNNSGLGIWQYVVLLSVYPLRSYIKCGVEDVVRTIRCLTAEDPLKAHQYNKSSAVMWLYADCLLCEYAECFVRLEKASRIPVPVLGNAGETTCYGGYGVVAQ